MNLLQRAGAVFVSAVLAFGQSSSLMIRSAAPGTATVIGGSAASRPLTIVVEDASGRPVSGATVTFRLPSVGVRGRFASGMLSESLITASDGKASVHGIRWGTEAGSATVRVVAIHESHRAELDLPVEVLASSPDRHDRARKGSGSSGRKWLVLAGIAGGAVAGIAFASGGRGGSAAAAGSGQPAQPVVIQPPTISIGTP